MGDGEETPFSIINKGSEGEGMYTVSDIVQDISRGCVAHNMQEDRFSYRILFFVNGDGSSSKHYINTQYDGIRKALENIIRNNLTLTNSVVIAAVTVWKDEEIISLLSKAYGFSLDRYFRQINGEYSGKKGIVGYGRYAAR